MEWHDGRAPCSSKCCNSVVQKIIMNLGKKLGIVFQKKLDFEFEIFRERKKKKTSSSFVTES